MAITYTYMYTNTAFNASALNLRFEPFLGAGTGLNKITLDELSLGAFRHNLIPRLIHNAEISTEDLIAKAAISDPQTDYFSTRRDLSFSSVSTGTTGDIMTVDYDLYPVQLTMNASENVGAILVMANIDVDRITTFVNGVGVVPHEDVGYALAWIRIVDSGGKDHDLPHTMRTLSPRLTIRTSNGGTPTSFALTGDTNTNQDLSIRTMITQSDLDTLVDVAKVQLCVAPSSAGGTTELRIGKGNLTAIPLHAKVN